MPLKHYALVDSELVEDSLFLRRTLGDPALKSPDPVFPGSQAFGSVLRDSSGLWRAWHQSFAARDPAKDVVGIDCLLRYSTSRDGIKWDHPDLGLVTEDGSRKNNIIIGSRQQDSRGRYLVGYGGVAGWCVLDATITPHPAARARFTAMTVAFPTDSIGGICLAHSDDGIHWTAYPENPVIIGSQDTQNCFFYCPRRKQYICYQRPTIYCGVEAHANRKMARLDSPDLVNWSPSRVMLDTDEADSPAFAEFNEPGMPKPRGRNKQFQGLSPFPYHDTYLGLTWFYDVTKGTFATEMVRSHDSIHWQREALREPLIADNRPAGFTGKLPLPMGSPPVLAGDELFIYESNSPHDHHSVATSEFDKEKKNRSSLLTTTDTYLITLKRDRWISYDANHRPGELLTTPLTWRGDGPLTLNAQINSGGSISVEFEDQWSRPIRECHLGEIAPWQGPLDSTALPIAFGPGPKTIVKFPPFSGVPGIRLRFRLTNAKLFGFTAHGTFT